MKTVLVAFVLAALSLLRAQDHVLSALHVSAAEVYVDSIALKFSGNSVVEPTPNFGGVQGTDDTADLRAHPFPDEGIEVHYRVRGLPMLAFAIRTPVQDTYYVLPDTGSIAAGRIKFYVGQGGTSESRPVTLSRLSVWPNPFVGRTRLSFALTSSTHARLEIFDATGQLVMTLHDGRTGPGEQSFAWNGLTADGSLAGTGIYLARLTSGSSRTLAKLILTD
jgi:hypothetical protein